jgi:hypothetical protein
VGDVDGDGLNEVVVLTREGNLFVWDTSAPAGPQEWPKKRHDLRNTGNYEEPAGQSASALYDGTLIVRRARLVLPAGANDDKLTIKATLALAAASDGIDPLVEGLILTLDDLTFSLPASGFTGTPGRWRYRDSDGTASQPDGITKVVLRQASDGSLRLKIKGRDLDLSTFDGTNDRVVAIGLLMGNDRATTPASLRRTGRNLRAP